jgi:predicted nucleotidyltransferase
LGIARRDNAGMAPFLERHREAIESLCRKHHVKRLEVFGSAARDDFDEHRSDVDLIVEFYPPGIKAPWTYFYLKEALETLLDRKVDLVEPGGIRNQYFKRAIAIDRKPFFVAA